MSRYRIRALCVLTVLLAPFAFSFRLACQETMSPEQWARLKMDTCRAEEQRRAENLALVTAKVEAEGYSREERNFPALEAASHAKLLNREGRLRLDELEYLLFRKKKQSLQKMFFQYAGSPQAPDAMARAPLEHGIRVLTASATPCSLNALEAALLIATFGLPLNQRWTDPSVNGTRILQEVEDEYSRRSEAGKTAKQSYLELRESDREANKRLVKALLQDFIDRLPERNQLSTDVQNRLLEDLEGFIHLSAEPLRIDMLAHVMVGDFERYLGIRSTESAVDRLEADMEKRLFKNLPALHALESRPPAENLATVDSVLDKWLKRALPELRKRLYRDPFASHSFYVQTGMVARRPSVFRASRLRVDDVTPDLASLRGLSFDAAQKTLVRLKVPWYFVGQYLELEKRLTEVTLSREGFLRRVEQDGLTARDVGALKTLLDARVEPGYVSTLDLMGVFVRDASRFQGKPDRHPLIAGLQAFHRAKTEELERAIEALPGGPERERLAGFLRTAGEWMLELEERQASDHHLQFSTGGGFVGWVLRRTVIGNGLPVQVWAPGGATGDSFARMVDQVVPKWSSDSFQAKPTPDIHFLESGESYYQALIQIINESQKFINIQQHDWKLDRGGREIAYRIMAKKLGLSGEDYDGLLRQFGDGIPLDPSTTQKTLFYDLPTKRIKNLLFFKLFTDPNDGPAQEIGRRIEQTTGKPLACPTVSTCGDLSWLYQKAGKRYDRRRASEPGYAEAWELYADLQSLFEGRPVEPQDARRKKALADYVKKPAAVRGFVRRHGLTQPGSPQTPFEVNLIAEGKRDMWYLIFKAGQLHNPLLEFDVRYLPWKGGIEYPWHVGRVPVIGRWHLGFLPMPYVPWPWLRAVPKLAWTGLDGSLGFQHLLSTDARNTWGVVTHSKHVSNETTMLESGMGFASKYFNMYPGFRTWHDTGVVARGPIVADANHQYARWFNSARHNNRGLPGSHGVRVPRLKGDEYAGSETPGPRAWILTTDPESRDYNYRGVFMAALAAARENIYIENAFYADRMITRMLIQKAREFRARVDCTGLTEAACVAKKRDAVNIFLVLPLATDQPLVDAVGRSDYYEMINEGVKLYLWHPRQGYAAQRMLHTKAWLVDYRPGEQGLSYVGSHNADRRSLWSDNEMGLLSASPAFADSVYQDLFLRDMQNESTRMTTAGYELDRRVRPARRMGRLIRTVLGEIFWAF